MRTVLVTNSTTSHKNIAGSFKNLTGSLKKIIGQISGPLRICIYLFFLLSHSQTDASDDKIISLQGKTMGTTFSIRYRTEAEIKPKEVQDKVDQLLKSINQVMSTYIPDSELSVFNQSHSTDWQNASTELVFVISTAQKISELTDGAFDVTVGPLVNLWNFGPEEKKGIPTQGEIKKALESVGYQLLEYRESPPGIKKKNPDLYVDLSAIAKGYAVDRVAEILNDLEIKNFLVEIGGEIRTQGAKTENGFWKVAIEKPNPETQNSIKEILKFNNQAIATSGNYRNFHLIDEKLFSHTINPKTGNPVEHKTVSVSVIGESCMECDAWATALSVLPAEKSITLAKSQNLKVLLIEKKGTAQILSATDSYLKHPKVEMSLKQNKQTASPPNLIVLFLVIGIFGIAIIGMAVGVIFSNRCIKGSCGGLSQFQSEDGQSACELCSTPPEECENRKTILENQQS
jgi:FAD:protein FMN transferase